MADFDTRPYISDNDEQPAIVQPFAQVWHQIISDSATANNFKQVKEVNLLAGAFQSDVQTPIENLKIPDGWEKTRTERGGIGQRALDEYSAPDGSGVTLSLYQEGLPLQDKAATALNEVLGKGAHQLLPNEIVAVRDAIGFSNAGDNQYTDKNYRPAFNLTAAGVQKIGGIDVLVVEGKYNSGGLMFKGIFAPFVDEQGRTRVQQVFLQGSPEQFPKHMALYKSVLDSIQWKADRQAGDNSSQSDDGGMTQHMRGMIR